MQRLLLVTSLERVTAPVWSTLTSLPSVPMSSSATWYRRPHWYTSGTHTCTRMLWLEDGNEEGYLLPGQVHLGDVGEVLGPPGQGRVPPPQEEVVAEGEQLVVGVLARLGNGGRPHHPDDVVDDHLHIHHHRAILHGCHKHIRLPVH